MCSCVHLYRGMGDGSVIGWQCTLLGLPSQPHWLLYYYGPQCGSQQSAYICTLGLWVTPSDSCAAGHLWGVCSLLLLLLPPPHHTCGLYTVHLCVSFFVQIFSSFFLKHSCAFYPMKLQKLTDNTYKVPNISQTVVSTLDPAHLTHQILLYECKPIKWSSSALFAVASWSYSPGKGGAGRCGTVKFTVGACFPKLLRCWQAPGSFMKSSEISASEAGITSDRKSPQQPQHKWVLATFSLIKEYLQGIWRKLV